MQHLAKYRRDFARVQTTVALQTPGPIIIDIEAEVLAKKLVGGICTGGGSRGGGKRDSQGGRKQNKKGEIMQYYTIKKKQRGRSQQIEGGHWD